MAKSEQQPITVLFTDGDGVLLVSDLLNGPTPIKTERALKSGTFQPKEFDPTEYQNALLRREKVTLFVRVRRLFERQWHKGRHVVPDGSKAINVFREKVGVAKASMLTGRGTHLRKVTIFQLEDGGIAVGDNNTYRYRDDTNQSPPLARLDRVIFNQPRLPSSLHKAGTIFTDLRYSPVPKRIFMVENDLAAVFPIASVPHTLGIDSSMVTVFLTRKYGVPNAESLMRRNGISLPPNVIFIDNIMEAAQRAVEMKNRE